MPDRKDQSTNPLLAFTFGATLATLCITNSGMLSPKESTPSVQKAPAAGHLAILELESIPEAKPVQKAQSRQQVKPKSQGAKQIPKK